MHCNKCSMDKMESEFYACSQTKCKDCTKQAVREYRAKNLAYLQAYDRMRGNLPHRVAARAQYQTTRAYAESHRKANDRWVALNPLRRKASHAVGNALRDGRLTKTPCQICGRLDVEGHHPDYSRPLDVVWLCPQHHHEVHQMADEMAA